MIQHRRTHDVLYRKITATLALRVPRPTRTHTVILGRSFESCWHRIIIVLIRSARLRPRQNGNHFDQIRNVVCADRLRSVAVAVPATVGDFWRGRNRRWVLRARWRDFSVEKRTIRAKKIQIIGWPGSELRIRATFRD